jgi:formate hydrogenlyase subunit 3/multisubunit Na+/H+ antiporter MnhD subunit
MISLALLVGLLGLVPAASGVIFILGGHWLSRRAAAIWCGLVLIFCLIVVLYFISLLGYGQTIQATAFMPGGWARWLQLSYQVDAFNVFSALVIGVLASAVAAVLIAIEPAQADSHQQDEQQPAHIKRQDRPWQAGVLLVCLGAIFTVIFANNALWTAIGWGLASLCALVLYAQGKTHRWAALLLATPVVSAIVLYLALLPAISTREDNRLDLLNGLSREPLWAAIIMLLALLAPGVVLLIQQALSPTAPRPAGMSQSAAYVLMASPATFTAFARLALLIAGPGSVRPGAGSVSWLAFSLVIVWTTSALAMTAAILALRAAERASLPLFLSIQLLNWMFLAIAITGAAAVNGALLLKLLRFLALGALLLAGGYKLTQPILRLSWWLAALALSAFPFFATFSSAWLITANAISAGPAWVAGVGVSWLALLLATLAIVRAGGKEPAPAEEGPPGAASQAAAGPGFLMFLLALLALVTGIAPEVAVKFFTGPAASSLPVISSSLPSGAVQVNPLGLLTGTGQWLPGLFWLLALLLFVLILLLTRHERQSASTPFFLGGETDDEHASDTIASDTPDADTNRAPAPASQS